MHYGFRWTSKDLMNQSHVGHKLAGNKNKNKQCPHICRPPSMDRFHITLGSTELCWISFTSPTSGSSLGCMVRVSGLVGSDLRVDIRSWKTSAIQQPQKAQLSHLPWRNWLARSTVRLASAWFGYREVDSSSLSGRAHLLLVPRLVLGLQSNIAVQCDSVDIFC
jgi:hypothetical protein